MLGRAKFRKSLYIHLNKYKPMLSTVRKKMSNCLKILVQRRFRQSLWMLNYKLWANKNKSFFKNNQ